MKQHSTAEINAAMEEFERQVSQTFPFEPVEEHLHETRVSELSDYLDITRDVIKRYKEGGLSVDEADKIACRLGDHPSAIWLNWNDIPPISENMLNRIEHYQRTHKKCARCCDWKSREKEYNKRASSPDGRSRYCRQCTQEYEHHRKANLQRRLVSA